MAVRASIARVAAIDPAWAEASVLARAVETTVPAMPMNDWELMQGARERALAVRDQLQKQRRDADIYVGLEGGFHSISIEGEWHTFLRGWAYATDGKTAAFGATPSISVPASLVKKVIEGRRELGLVIDEVAGIQDVRSRQGAWGILSRDLVTRAMSFEVALMRRLRRFTTRRCILDLIGHRDAEAQRKREIFSSLLSSGRFLGVSVPLWQNSKPTWKNLSHR